VSTVYEITILQADKVISDGLQCHKSSRNQACPYPDVEPSTSLQAENFQTDHVQLSPRTKRGKGDASQS
jgi:hypothetical protein